MKKGAILVPTIRKSTYVNYYISDEVPEAWNHIIDTFMTMVQWNCEFNNGPEIENVAFTMKRGLLHITYAGGDSSTDLMAHFSREMSSNVCAECGVPATRHVFGSPRCDECD